MNEINFIIYQTPQGNVNIEAVVKDETLWLTQKAMAELFDCSVENIALHLKTLTSFRATAWLPYINTTPRLSPKLTAATATIKR